MLLLVAFSGHPVEWAVGFKISPAIEAGVLGYIAKDTGRDELVRAIHLIRTHPRSTQRA